MKNKLKQIGLILIIIGTCFVLNSCDSATPSSSNTMPIDLEKGYVVIDEVEGELIPAKDGVLEGLVPMVDFEFSGLVYKKKKDRQDGFGISLTLVFGKLAEDNIFEYLVNDGAMNKSFDDGFMLNTNYFQSHIAAFYIHPATDNLKEAINALKVGDQVRLKGHFVYLNTKKGLVKTSLNPDEFKCKYIFLSEMATKESIYN
jgi:hypothetical protein